MSRICKTNGCKNGSVVMSAKVTEDQYNQFTILSYDINLNKSEIMRKCIKEKLFKNKLKIKKLEKLQLKEEQDSFTKYITFWLPVKEAERVELIGRKNYMRTSRLLGLCVCEELNCRKEEHI